MKDVALLGNGEWGSILEKYLEKSSVFNLRYVFSRSGIKLKETSDIEEILNSDIDAVFIALPPALLVEYTRKCLEHGKHVFCEKPLSSVPAEVKELYELANKKGLGLFVNYIYTLSPSINFIKENLPILGKISSINLYLKQHGRFYENQNSFDTLGCHMVSCFFYWFPTISISHLKFEVINHDSISYCNHLSLIIRTPDFSVVMEADLLSEEKERKFVLHGEKGKIEFTPLKIENICLEANGERVLKSFDESNNIERVLSRFYDIIEGRVETNYQLCHKVSITLNHIQEHENGR